MTCDYCGKSLSCADKPRDAPNGLPLFVCNKCYEQLKKSKVVDTKENKSKEINIMNKIEVRCSNCGTSFVIGNSGNPVSELSEGIHYLVPETVRNEHKCESKKDARLEALREAGIDVSKLQTLMQTNADVKDIFNTDDPIVEELSKGGFIKNPELFRRWIAAQTFRLLKDPNGWTTAVRKTYDTKYVYNQTKRELKLLCHLKEKCPNDIRFQFFTLEDLKTIFSELMDFNKWYWYRSDEERRKNIKHRIITSLTYKELLEVVENTTWKFDRDCTFKPKAWLNCFKGAGAYYTLQNIIRTHGLVIPKCKDMNESLKFVDDVFKSIIAYESKERRWDILLSVLTMAVEKTKFELKY